MAAGRAEEVRTGLRLAVLWGDLRAAEVQSILDILDRVIGMLWSLTEGP